MNLSKFNRSAHRWLGLVLAIQVLLWMASGAVMSWFDIAMVRGETNAVRSFAPELDLRSYANPGGVIARAPGATRIELRSFLERPVYEADGPNGLALFDAETGERISPISEDLARRVAQRDFIGEGAIVALELMHAPPHEYRGSTPVWRASFDDRLKTRLYISPETGEIVARRNMIWRIYDFFWMLHIMDYKERTDFNNPLVKSAAITGFLFALTGIYLVILDLMRGRYLPRSGQRRFADRSAAADSSSNENNNG